MSTSTLPPLRESIAHAIANDGDFTIGDAASKADTTKTDAAQAVETAAAEAAATKEAETAKAVADKSAADKTPKGLSDSLESDQAEEVTQIAAVEDEPRDGEKPSAFIKRLKAEKAELANRLKQIEKAAPKKAEASPDELAALRKELEERDQIIETTAFERSKKFQESFAKPLEKARESAKELIGKFTETKGVFERALALDGRERMDFLKEHVEDAAPAVYAKMGQIEELAKERDATLANRQEISKALAEEQGKNEGAEILRQFDSRRETIAAKLSVYRGENADALEQQARALLTGNAPATDIIDAARMAAALPHYLGLLKAANAELAIFKARDAEREGDTAAIRARGTDGGKTDGDSVLVDGKLPPLKTALTRSMAHLRK